MNFRGKWGKLQGHLINYLRFIRLFVAKFNPVYIKGLRTLTLDVYEKNLITSEQKAFLDSLISKMNFEELKKVVGVSKDDDS